MVGESCDKFTVVKFSMPSEFATVKALVIFGFPFSLTGCSSLWGIDDLDYGEETGGSGVTGGQGGFPTSGGSGGQSTGGSGAQSTGGKGGETTTGGHGGVGGQGGTPVVWKRYSLSPQASSWTAVDLNQVWSGLNAPP